jgi:hypothetical protein
MSIGYHNVTTGPAIRVYGASSPTYDTALVGSGSLMTCLSMSIQNINGGSGGKFESLATALTTPIDNNHAYFEIGDDAWNIHYAVTVPDFHQCQQAYFASLPDYLPQTGTIGYFTFGLCREGYARVLLTDDSGNEYRTDYTSYAAGYAVTRNHSFPSGVFNSGTIDFYIYHPNHNDNDYLTSYISYQGVKHLDE